MNAEDHRQFQVTGRKHYPPSITRSEEALRLLEYRSKRKRNFLLFTKILVRGSLARFSGGRNMPGAARLRRRKIGYLHFPAVFLLH